MERIIMAFRVSSIRLIKITKLLERSDKALNILDNGHNNAELYHTLKKEIQDCIQELKNVYDLENFDEWKKIK